jgi:membrane protease YdiL (CAAX protease family)
MPLEFCAGACSVTLPAAVTLAFLVALVAFSWVLHSPTSVRSLAVSLTAAAVIALAFAQSLISPFAALVVVVAFLLFNIPYGRTNPHSLGTVLIVSIASLLALAAIVHLVDGLQSLPLCSFRLSPISADFELTVNFSKVIIAAGVLLGYNTPRATSAKEWRRTVRALPAIVFVILFVACAGLAVSFLRLDWTPASTFFPFAACNLLFTCFSEEVLFRGFLFQTIEQLLIFHRPSLAERHRACYIAGAFSSVCFGVCHFAGGLAYVALATICGAAYCASFKAAGGLHGSVACHWMLNCTHFLILTYPYYQPPPV